MGRHGKMTLLRYWDSQLEVHRAGKVDVLQ
jgi:hypothetical protein